MTEDVPHLHAREMSLPNALYAERASLNYVDSSSKGMVRKRWGRGFRYLRDDGTSVADEETLSRIRSLAIPPAWTDVWISDDPLGHIQATGRDARGRKQFRYHPDWSFVRDQDKFGRLLPFAASLPELRRRIDADLSARNGLGRNRVIAAVVWLLDHSMIRIGNAAYVRENRSFGLTTLRSRHLDIEGSRLRFSFKGKSGKEWRVQLTSPRLARTIRSIQELPGQHLFQYIGDDGSRHAISSHDVNDYIRETIGDGFTSKDFRTWGGTVRAVAALADQPLPETRRETASVLNAAIDEVSRKLGNTRAVCRKCYIHPKVMQSWLAGELGSQIAEIEEDDASPIGRLDHFEVVVLGWLRRFVHSDGPPNRRSA
jgi:DNA topoisomerase-1